MNLKEVNELNEELKKIIEKKAIIVGMNAAIGEKMIDKYVKIYPDDFPIMGMLELQDKNYATVKPGNILINQKAMLNELFEVGMAFHIPSKMMEIVSLCLLIGKACVKSMKIELDEKESYIVAYLHIYQLYNIGEEENLFYYNFTRWYKEMIGEEISRKRIEKSLDNLKKIKSIDVIEGRIVLIEKVWHNKI